MNKFNINQWLDQTVSHATLNPDHLIPVFKGFLKKAGIKTAPRKEFTVDEYLEYLFDEMNKLAPDGYAFTSHPFDGADFGFWKYDEEQS